MLQFHVEDAVTFLLTEGHAFVESQVESFGALRLPKECEEAVGRSY